MSRPSPNTAQELARLRQSAGLSQAEAAAVIGVSRQAYALRESGVTPIQDEEWQALRAAFAAAGLPEDEGAALRQLRLAAGLTQAEAGERLGMSRVAYDVCERGVRRIQPEEWHRARELFAPRAPATLPEQLRHARTQAGLSLEEAGAAVGLLRETYRLREEGRSPVTGPELALLAKLYGKPFRELFPAYSPSEGERLLCEALRECL